MFNLDDLLYTYPEQGSVPMSGELLKRREFSDLETTEEGIIIQPGERFNYQEIGRRYMIPYDRLLCILEPGTGKTCYDISVAERWNLINEWLDTTVQMKSLYRRAYFVTTSKFLLSEFNYQFICRCTDGRYNVDKLKYDVNHTGRSLTISSQVNKFYTPLIYSQLSKDLDEFIIEETDDTIVMNGEAIRDRFDNSIFFLDEAHYFRNNYSSKSSRERNTIDRAYRKIREMFRHLTNYKLIISTATPMIDQANDFIPLINLLNVGDPNYPELQESNNISTDTLDRYFNGKVAYVKSLPIGVKINFTGMDLHISDNHSTKVVPLLMSQEQSDNYLNLANNRNQYTQGIYTRPRLYSTYFRPNGDRMERKRIPSLVQLGDEYIQDIRTNLQNYSVKFKYILDYIESRPDRLYFIYWDLLEGGLADLANVLISNGWEMYNGERGIFESEVMKNNKIVKSQVSSYCASTNSEGERVLTPFSSNFPKKKRFVLLDGTTQDVKKRQIKEAYTHPDNRYGEYIQILIGSAVTKLGLNFENVTEMFFIGPSWNYGDFYQAMYRIIRAQSHVELIRDKQREIERRIQEGLPVESSNTDVTVNIHRLCAIPRYIPVDQEGYLEGTNLRYEDESPELLSYLLNSTEDWMIDYGDGRDPVSPVIDIEMYITGEYKEVEIRNVLRIMKENAIDCPMNARRNMVGQDGSLSCDFSPCVYECNGANIPRNEIGSNVSAYQALYLGEKIDSIIRNILTDLSNNYYVRWGYLSNSLKDQDIRDFRIIQRFAYKLHGMIFTDRYGIPYVIQVNDSGIYLEDRTSRKSLGYGQNVMKLGQDILYNMNRGLNSIFLDDQEDITVNMDVLESIKYGVPYMDNITKQRVLEKGYSMYINRDSTEVSEELIDELFNVFSYFMVEVPKKELVRGNGQTIVNELRDSTEYLHFFFNQIRMYDINTLTRAIPDSWVRYIRIFDQNRQEWRDVTRDEIILYLDDINEKIRVFTRKFGSVYGYRNIIDYRFRIVTPIADRTITQDRLEHPDDIRRQPRGTTCQSMETPIKIIQTIYLVDPEFYRNSRNYGIPERSAELVDIAEIYRNELNEHRYDPVGFSMEELDLIISGDIDITTEMEMELRTFYVLHEFTKDKSIASICQDIPIEKLLQDRNKWFYM